MRVFACAARHPRAPWLARLLLATLVAYVISPVDLIPDFIPVLGLLDEAVLIPLCLVLVMRLIPEDVWTESRSVADAQELPSSGRAAEMLIYVVWAACAAAIGYWLWRGR